MEQPPQKTAKVERLAEMPEEWRLLREKILNNFESKTDGLNIEMVKDFMKEQNLPITGFVMFDDEDIPELKKLFADGLADALNFLALGFTGVYLQKLNLLLIHRYRVPELLSGSLAEEALLVHEMAHGSNGHVQFIKNTKTGRTESPRAGFAIVDNESPWGFFLEEGFAQMMSIEYMKKNILPETKKKTEKNLNSTGFSVTSERVLMSSGPGKDNFEIPVNTILPREEDNGLTMAGGRATPVATGGLMMLCEKEPKLRQTLIEARSNIEKLREIPKLINAIKPGLYVEIQKCGYSQDEFIRVQNIIKEAVESSK